MDSKNKEWPDHDSIELFPSFDCDFSEYTGVDPGDVQLELPIGNANKQRLKIKKCECGAFVAGSPVHSIWCPGYESYGS